MVTEVRGHNLPARAYAMQIMAVLAGLKFGTQWRTTWSLPPPLDACLPVCALLLRFGFADDSTLSVPTLFLLPMLSCRSWNKLTCFPKRNHHEVPDSQDKNNTPPPPSPPPPSTITILLLQTHSLCVLAHHTSQKQK